MQPLDFYELPGFTKDWKRLGLGDQELWQLQRRLMIKPDEGKLVPGGVGRRKLRISLTGRGRRGGGRVIYLLYLAQEAIVLASAYAKNK